MLHGQLHGRTFSLTREGKTLLSEITHATLTKLNEVLYQFYSGFKEGTAHLLEHLTRSRFVLMRKPPAPRHSYPNPESGRGT